MGDHQVRERALILILQGSVTCTSGADPGTCVEGTPTVFEPGEPHTLRALQPTRLLLVLSPLPAHGHYNDGGGDDPHELPVHATQRPLGDSPS